MMNRTECNRTMINDLASSECRGTSVIAPQPGAYASPATTACFDPRGLAQGCAVAPSATQSIPVSTAFSRMPQPVGAPILNVPGPNAPRIAANAPVNPVSPQRRSRKARVLISAGLATVLLLGFGGGMTAFAHDDADSRMPIVQEYEQTVTPDVSTAVVKDSDADVVTIVDDPTPMAASPTDRVSADDFIVDVEPAPVTDAAPSPLASALEQPPAEEAPAPLAPYTLEINGTRVPYIHSVLAALCPDRNAALWAGSDDTTDGSYGYFIGHNPGDFACVYALVPGNYVTLCDANGNLRNYTVTQLYDIPNTTTLQDLIRDVIPEGESLIMQTCIGDGSRYRIVVCQ